MADVIVEQKQMAQVGKDLDDVQMDSITCSRTEQAYRDEEMFLGQLVQIDEQMGTDDLDLLKFVCKDHIGVSKLEGVKSALDLFLQLKKLAFIRDGNVDYLIECLGLIHRFDLIRLLGFDDLDRIKERLPRFQKIGGFRKLMLEIAEDLDDTEMNKMKFLLSGSVRKRRLQDFKSVLDLFVYMEQENLLAHQKTELLVDMLTNIRRADLVHRIQQFSGGPPRSAVTLGPRVQNGQLEVQPQNRPFPNFRANNIVPSGPPIQHISPNGSGVNPNQEPVIVHVNRSVSAGTLSVSNSEGDIVGNDITGWIPPNFIDELVEAVVTQDKWTNLVIELNFTDARISDYERQYQEPPTRVRKALDDWITSFQNNRQVAPRLLYVLERIDCKALKDKLLQWQDAQGQSSQTEGQGHAMAISTGRSPVFTREQNHGPTVNYTVNTGEAQFVPSGPPPKSENEYSSLRAAQPMQPIIPGRNPVQNDLHVTEIQAGMNGINIGQNVMGQLNMVSPNPYRTNSHPVLAPNSHANIHGVPIPQYTPNMPNAVYIQPPQHTVLQQQQQQQQGLNQRTDSAPAMDSSELPVYNMSRKPRGWCVIINNREFKVVTTDSESKQMPERKGTDVDAESLQHIFTTLGFVVRRRDNLSSTEMMQFMIDVAHNVDHTEFDCFICCILTHGVLNHLYGIDGKLVSIKDLTTMFQANRCPSLVGKPKLFFLQACQGRDKMTGGEMINDIERDANLTTDSDKEMIPNEADFMIGYATVPGYVSFRSKTHGSWYIRKLCELLEKLSHKEDLLSILVQVNNEVSKANASFPDGLFKQTPAPLVTLRKKLYFL